MLDCDDGRPDVHCRRILQKCSGKTFSMKPLDIVTLVLDGMPFLPIQFSNFNRIDTSLVDWKWHIVHGVSANTGSTKWCQPQSPRLSNDGTTELLATWKNHPRISIHECEFWSGGKDHMFCRALDGIVRPTTLLQVDADEIWEHEQLETLVGFFNAYQEINCARFFCQYFLGPNIVITSQDGYGNAAWDWFRAWRYSPGHKLISHEPPNIDGLMQPCATREQTRDAGLVFQHWAYMFEKQVAYKQDFYGYKDAVKHWRRLQSNTQWPIKLKTFLPWVDDNAIADVLHRS